MALFVRTKTLLSVAVLGMMVGVADAQDRRQNAAGQFDYYVLALSWSPSFCEIATGNARRQQCGVRPFSFVVHGLWPQYAADRVPDADKHDGHTLGDRLEHF